MFASKDVFLTPPSGGYNIARSVRLRSSASAYFNRTPATTSNSQKFTLSTWVKRGKLGVSQVIYAAGNSAGAFFDVQFTSGDLLRFDFTGVGATLTNAVYRDPAAWYNIVVAVDTTQSTSTNRALMYVNGVLITSYSQYNVPAQNATTPVNTASSPNYLGCYDGNASFLDGYQTEVQLIDGQQLTPSSFGSTNAITGVWQPAKYTGTYGTNGFYLNFSDNSNNTATTIGKDYSGNGNNWTPNNISVTAGATYDSMTDVPTLTSATAANYCVLNGANNGYGTTTLSQGNLYAVLNAPGATEGMAVGTIGMTTGKWYWEVNVVSANTTYAYPCSIGIGNLSTTTGVGMPNTSYAYNSKDGNKLSNTGSFVSAAYGASYTANDVIGVAFDADAGTLTFYKNNTSQGTAFTGIASSTWFARVSSNDGCTTAFNFGQRPFSYTPPTGYVALNTYNLPDSTIKNGAGYMAATLYTGNSATQSLSNSVNGVSFQPDFVWIKSRSAAYYNTLYDSVRGSGATKSIYSNTTDAEGTFSTLTNLSSFNSNGFTVGTTSSSPNTLNESGVTFVGWQWKAGTTSSSNTNGSITSTVSVGATQGFSVVKFTSPASGSFTVGHGLNAVPNLIITKPTSRAAGWVTYHSSLNGGNPGTSYFVYLDTTAGQASLASPPMWGSAVPTSSVFGASVSATCAPSEPLIAYCFSAVKGYSAFGSYTGNGSTDGPFVYTGFRPRFVMWKRTDTTGDWVIQDTTRGPYNQTPNYLIANTSGAEGAPPLLDINSNGFKVRINDVGTNASGGTYIYMAFAENAFKNSLAR
jgi:hypothetical protein